MNRAVLITGATGFVGSHLLRKLRAERDSRITGFGRQAPSHGLWDAFVCGDVTDREAVSRAVRESRPDEVYHLAGITRGTDAELEAVNLTGTRHLVEAVAAHRPGATLTVVGSAAEYGTTAAVRSPLAESDRCEPADGYGRTKHAAVLETLAAAQAGLRANVVRPFNLVGAGVPDSLVAGATVSRLRDCVTTGTGVVRMGNVESVRDFLDVGDAVDGMVALARSGLTGRVFNLCSGRPCSIRELVDTLVRIAHADVRIVTDDVRPTAADVPISVGSHCAATHAFGFRPATPLTDSLRAAWAGRHHGAVPS